MLKLLSIVGVAGTLLVEGSLAHATDPSGPMFIVRAIRGNVAEIQMGQLAQRNGRSAEIKAFGQALEEHHSAANSSAAAVAKRLGMPLPTEPNKTQKAEYRNIAKMTGAAFEKAFLRQMIIVHKQRITEYTKAASLKNPAADYASSTLPTLQKHLQTAQSLMKAQR